LGEVTKHETDFTHHQFAVLMRPLLRQLSDACGIIACPAGGLRIQITKQRNEFIAPLNAPEINPPDYTPF
jgi:hypothetical protein